MRQHIPFLTIFLLLIFASHFTQADTNPPRTQEEMQKALNEGKKYLIAFRHDSVKVITNKLIEELAAQNLLDTPFGLSVRLLRAEALERNHENEEALPEHLKLIDETRERKLWELYAAAHISLATFYEKSSRPEDCYKSLLQAKATINKHQLDSLYPKFAVRISSYNRFFGERDSAIFYAKEAVRTGPNFNNAHAEADGNLLMGMLLIQTDTKKSIEYFRKCGQLFSKARNYSSSSLMMINLRTIYWSRLQDTVMALNYNDSAIAISKKAIELGHQYYKPLANALKFRSDLFMAKGMSDSAVHYLNEANEVKAKDASAATQAQLMEIEAKYDSEKKTMKIEEQERERKWLFGFIAVVGISMIVLGYYYFQLRKANYKTKAQAIEIAHANKELAVSLEQQIMLQGEIHHRVKNNLQVLIRLLELQRNEIKDTKALQSLEAMSNRIYSMSAIHEILYQKQGTEVVDLLEYTQNLCNHFSLFMEEQNKPAFNLEIENKYFNLETLMPLGIILNELLTNSLKYAANLGQQLKIDIQLLAQPDSDGYCIYFKDNGPGFPSGVLQAREGGLGSYLLRSMSRQLRGSMESMNDGGAVYKIFFKEKN